MQQNRDQHNPDLKSHQDPDEPATVVSVTRAPRGTDQGKRDGFIAEEIAECLLEMGQDEEAQPYLREAYEELSKQEWLQRSDPDQIRVLPSGVVDRQRPKPQQYQTHDSRKNEESYLQRSIQRGKPRLGQQEGRSQHQPSGSQR